MPASVTVSPSLVSHVRMLYDASLEYLATKKGVRYGINGYTDHALPAYVMAVAAVEAYVNESFLSDVSRMMFKESTLWHLPADWIEKLDLAIKLILIPQHLFGESLRRDQQPYQDMALLIRVRNTFVHYKMTSSPPKFLQALDDRRISLIAPQAPNGADFLWPHKLCSSEGIRWAHNTACQVVQGLASLVPKEKADFGLIGLASNFTPIPESYPREWLVSRGVDPDSNYPP